MKPVVLPLSIMAGLAYVLVSNTSNENNNELLAIRMSADQFNYTRIKQAVISLRALRQLDPEFWSPYLQALYDHAKPDKMYCCRTAPATSRLMFMKLRVFHDEDLGAVMYFAGVHNDPLAIPEDIRELFVAMRRNACDAGDVE